MISHNDAAIHTIVTRVIGDREVGSAQMTSFHGIGDRSALPGGWQSKFVGGPVLPELKIVRDGNRIPDVTKPEGNFVVSQAVKSSLGSLPNVIFNNTSFCRLVNFYIPKNDMRCYSTNPNFNPRRALEKAKDDRKFHVGVGPYFELVVPRHRDIQSKFGQRKTITIRPSQWRVDESSIFEIAPNMMVEYPIQWLDGRFIFSHTAFEKISPFIDWDFFESQEYSV